EVLRPPARHRRLLRRLPRGQAAAGLPAHHRGSARLRGGVPGRPGRGGVLGQPVRGGVIGPAVAEHAVHPQLGRGRRVLRPRPAVTPDDIPPGIQVPPDEPGGYDRYGFRVPCLIASPFAKPGHVSSVVYDHTSILATIELKWNLPALTRRDAAATPLTDFID